MPHRTIAIITAPLTLLLATAAFAAGPLAGKTYSTTTPSYGYNEQHIRTHLHAGPLTLKVSGNGKTVTVHFSSDRAVLYCLATETLHLQTTSPAAISSSGSFTARVDEGFHAGDKKPAIVQVIAGKFSGRTVYGTIRTEAEPCGGTATFTATAP